MRRIIFIIILFPGFIFGQSKYFKTDMVKIEKCTYTRGNITNFSESHHDEKPVHNVTISYDFFIGKYEVTQKIWQEVMGNNPSFFVGKNRPVENVSWLDACKFCNSLSLKECLTPCYQINDIYTKCDFDANGYRLPTDAEWECAVRAGTQTDTYIGNIYDYSCIPIEKNVDLIGWYCGNSGDTTHNVGLKEPNKFGLYDMIGNVWEWTWDWYNDYYYDNSPRTDPRGPETGETHVFRGGSYENRAAYSRCSDRNRSPHWGYYSSLVGFRIVKVGTRECHQSAFDYPALNSAEDFFFIGDATLEGDCFRLTTTEEYQRGAIWYAEPVPVKNGFIAEFSFRFSQPANNDFEDGSEPGADGIAFVLQNHSESALGSKGFGIGYAQIPNSIAVEFDTYANDRAQLNNMKDPNGNHVAVQTYGQQPNSPSHGGGAVKAIEDDIIPIHSDSSLYYARIDYNLIENTLRVYLSDTGYMSEPCIELKDFDISSIIDLSDGEFCRAGITSATGNGWENHDIVSFSMCPFPTDAGVAVEDNTELYNDEISVYPNPASDFISIKVSAGFDGSYLKIVNLIGETIEEIKINDINDGIISYYTGDLSPGVYFIEISNSESKQHIKFIKK